MCKIGESKLEKNNESMEFSHIRSGLSGIATDPYLKHRNRKKKQLVTSSALVALIAGFIVVSPISSAPTIQTAWSAQPEAISGVDKQSAEQRCLREIESPGNLTGSTILDYRSGIGFLRLEVAGEFWNCGFSTSNETVSVTKWIQGISAPGFMIKTNGDIDPYLTLNLSSKSFDTGVQDFPTANFIAGSTPEGVSTITISVPGLPEGTATISNGVFGIWVPSEGNAELSFIDADGKVIQTLKTFSNN
jgi:hypothetical protein